MGVTGGGGGGALTYEYLPWPGKQTAEATRGAPCSRDTHRGLSI